MSQRPIARSADLSRLRDEGYTISIVGGFLVVGDIAFVDDEGTVQADGALVLPLELAGDVTASPSDHTARFMGGVPCDQNGKRLSHIINHTRAENLGNGISTSCYLSAKPHGGRRYDDFHHKATTYVGHILGPAQAIDPTITARQHRPVPTEPDDQSPFRYADTASSRAGIAGLTERFAGEVVGIVGLGGTGQHILDAVAKTPVAKIDIFDPDVYLTHNAFRGPGAATADELESRPLKVDHFGDVYDRMHRGIERHPYAVTEETVAELGGCTFVFIAIDDAEAKAPIIEWLIEAAIAFIDVGMGVELVDDRLVGLVRTTLVTDEHHDHAAHRIPTVNVAREDDVYRSNIQLIELNKLNAALAVIAWKRAREFYADLDGPHHHLYAIASNRIVNDDYRPEADVAGEVEDAERQGEENPA